MKKSRKLGDKINNVFATIVIILFAIIIVRIVIDMAKKDVRELPYRFYESSLQVIVDHKLYDVDSVEWDNSIHNPTNQPFVLEVAFDLEIPIDSVTQKQFDKRYGIER